MSFIHPQRRLNTAHNVVAGRPLPPETEAQPVIAEVQPVPVVIEDDAAVVLEDHAAVVLEDEELPTPRPAME